MNPEYELFKRLVEKTEKLYTDEDGIFDPPDSVFVCAQESLTPDMAAEIINEPGNHYMYNNGGIWWIATIEELQRLIKGKT